MRHPAYRRKWKKTIGFVLSFALVLFVGSLVVNQDWLFSGYNFVIFAVAIVFIVGLPWQIWIAADRRELEEWRKSRAHPPDSENST